MRICVSGKKPSLHLLERTHRVDLAWSSEVCQDDQVTRVYTVSAEQAADVFTKGFTEEPSLICAQQNRARSVRC